MPVLQHQAPGHVDPNNVLEIGMIATLIAAFTGAWHVPFSHDIDDQHLHRGKALLDSQRRSHERSLPTCGVRLNRSICFCALLIYVSSGYRISQILDVLDPPTRRWHERNL